jgi:hypothetical protein
VVQLGREIEVRAVPGMHPEQFEVIALEAGPPVPLRLPWLGFGPPERSEPLGETLAPDEPEPESAANGDEPLPAEPLRPTVEAAAALEAVDAAPEFPILPPPPEGEDP